tara:strand:+ start:69 stop:368 length:300 start_codon:yes stop_codon:yes gene_type:complete
MEKDRLKENQRRVQERIERYVTVTKRLDPHIVEQELDLEGGLIMPVTTSIQHEDDGHDVFYTAEYNNLHLRYGFDEIPYKSWSNVGTVTVYLSLGGKFH